MATVWMIDLGADQVDCAEHPAQQQMLSAATEAIAHLNTQTSSHRSCHSQCYWQCTLISEADLQTRLRDGLPPTEVAIVPDIIAERWLSIASLTSPIPANKKKQGAAHKLPGGVVLWADADRLSTETLLAWFHRNAADVILVDPQPDLTLLEKAIGQAIKRAVRAQQLISAGEQLLVDNQKLQQECSALQQDQTQGRALQERLMPSAQCRYGNLQIETYNQPVMTLSGDFMDHFEIDEHTVGFYLADISGHGVSAAIVTALLKSFFYRYLMFNQMGKSTSICNPGKLLSKLNRQMMESQLQKHMVIFYGVYDRRDGRLQYVNAGHHPAPFMVVDEERSGLLAMEKPLGLFSDHAYNNTNVSLPEQFQLVIYSDGWLDGFTCDEKNEKIDGIERWLQAVLTFKTPQSVAEKIAESPFNGHRQVDDMSLLLLSQS